MKKPTRAQKQGLVKLKQMAKWEYSKLKQRKRQKGGKT
jgi:hypothetical protein